MSHDAPAQAPARSTRRMHARDPHEAHRVATPLELLFDLCFVVAVAQAASHLHHAWAHGHGVHALASYAQVFFGIWWAWMNFTWFASAYDCDDVPYRLATLVQIAGVLILAAGVGRAFERGDLLVMTVGYAVMRVGLVSLWIRAGRADPRGRRTAFRYALGVSSAEAVWIALLWLPREWAPYVWLVGVPLELAVPVWAERAGPTSWHPHHIAERYGLLTLIVLGECVLSTTTAVESALDDAHLTRAFVSLIAGSLLIVFSMWWLYFDQDAHHHLRTTNRQAFLWGYGHYVVFASIAAVGAGLGTFTDFVSGHSPVDARTAGTALVVPVVAYLLSVWALHVRPLARGRVVDGAFLVAAVAAWLVCGLEYGALAVGLVLAGLVAVTVVARNGARHATHGA